MGDGPVFRRRVLIEDVRRDGSYLRMTWHAERSAFVVSTWRGEVCTGAVRVPVAAARELTHLLIDGLTQAATPPAPVQSAKTTGGPDVLARARAWLQRLRLRAEIAGRSGRSGDVGRRRHRLEVVPVVPAAAARPSAEVVPLGEVEV
jgi:hypothetical protein